MTPPSKRPTSFLPTSPGSLPRQQVARIVEVPALPPAPPARKKYRPREEAVLSVRLPNRVTLSRALFQAIDRHLKERELRKPKEERARVGFGPGSISTAVEIVPPGRRGGTWYLDTRATAGRRLPKSATARAQFVTSHVLTRGHFLRPTIQTVAAAGQTRKGGFHSSTSIAGLHHEIRSVLHFQLGEEVEPGYYALLPL